MLLRMLHKKQNISNFVLLSTLASLIIAACTFIGVSQLVAVCLMSAIAVSNILWFVRFDYNNELTRTNELVFIPQILVLFLVGV